MKSNVLYVSGQPQYSAAILPELNAEDFAVECVRTIAEAHARLGSEFAFDAMVVDGRLPDGDGARLITHAREHQLPLAIVSITDLMNDPDGQAALEAGADGWIPQGADPRPLTKALLHAISKRSTEARLRWIVERHPACLMRVDAAGTILAMNASGLAMVGANQLDQAVTKSFYLFVSEEHQERCREFISRICSGERSSMELDIVGLTGIRRTLEAHATALPNDLQAASSALAVLRDVSERRRLEKSLLDIEASQQNLRHEHDRESSDWEKRVGDITTKLDTVSQQILDERTQAEKTIAELSEALKVSEARFQSLTRGASFAIFRADEEGQLVDANPALLKLLGFVSAEELAEAFPAGMFASPDDWVAFVQHGHQKGCIDVIETSWRRKDGSRLALRVSGIATYDRDHEVDGFDFMIEDVSAYWRLEDELREIQKVAAVGRLADQIGSNLTQLLTTIVEHGEMLLRNLGQDDPRHKHAETAHRCALDARGLLRQLVAFSRKQAPSQLVSLDQLHHHLEGKLGLVVGTDIELTKDLVARSGHVGGNFEQIAQAIVNLIIAARDAMPVGGTLALGTSDLDVDPKSARELGLTRPGQYVRFQVRANGWGLDLELQQRLVEAFATSAGPPKGLGLGLSTAHDVVTQNGGYLQLHSEAGHLLMFTIYMPRVEFSAQPV